MPKQTTHDDDLLYTVEVAEMRQVDVRTVHRWVRAGLLKPAARGRGLRGTLVFRKADVDALDANKAAVSPSVTRRRAS